MGLMLDPWQRFVLEQSLGERDGKWSAFETAIIVGRQNGKGAILEARELAGLFLFDEELILHSAHQFKTASEGFRRVESLIRNCDWASRRVKRVWHSHGDECIELKTGQRLRFVARSRTSGRGFSGDLVILDEAFELGAEDMAALLPTLSARPNPQIWYASSAGMATSTQLASVRERGLTGEDPSLCYLEWSAEPGADVDDRGAWRQANPAFGIRIDEEFIARERRALDEDSFARERLGIWRTEADLRAIPGFGALADPASSADGIMRFAVDADPDQSWAAIGFAGRRADGLDHVEILDHREGMAWVVPRLIMARERAAAQGTDIGPITVDPRSTAGSLIEPLKSSGFDVATVTAREVADGCASFYTAATEGPALRFRPSPGLEAAASGARKRPLGDGWAWGRKSSAVSVCPLVAVTLARLSLHGTETAAYDVLDSIF